MEGTRDCHFPGNNGKLALCWRLSHIMGPVVSGAGPGGCGNMCPGLPALEGSVEKSGSSPAPCSFTPRSYSWSRVGFPKAWAALTPPSLGLSEGTGAPRFGHLRAPTQAQSPRSSPGLTGPPGLVPMDIRKSLLLTSWAADSKASCPGTPDRGVGRFKRTCWAGRLSSQKPLPP